MSHLLTPALSARPWKSSSSLHSWKNGRFPTPRVCCVGNQYQHHQVSDQDQVPLTRDDHSLRRRALMGLSSAVMLGLTWSDEQSASGAGRPPPPPPKEKIDPNVSGVRAKILASKRRKEAMKETVAKLREQGKAIDKNKEKDLPPTPAPPPPAPEDVVSNS